MSLAVAMKTGNGIVIHTGDGTEIGREPENIEKGEASVYAGCGYDGVLVATKPVTLSIAIY